MPPGATTGGITFAKCKSLNCAGGGSFVAFDCKRSACNTQHSARSTQNSEPRGFPFHSTSVPTASLLRRIQRNRWSTTVIVYIQSRLKLQGLPFPSPPNPPPSAKCSRRPFRPQTLPATAPFTPLTRISKGLSSFAARLTQI